MPASGALGPFLSAMMELRSQRLKEQESKAADMSALGSGLASGVSALGSGLTKGMEQSKKDALANKLGEQSGEGWMGGGESEIELRKAMGQWGSGGSSDALAAQMRWQAGQNATQNRWQQGQDIAKQQRDYQAKRNMSADSRQDINDLYGFQQTIATNLEKIAKPDISLDEYNHAAKMIRAAQGAAEKRKLPMEAVTIPPYMTTAQQEAVTGYQQSLQGRQGQPSTVPKDYWQSGTQPSPSATAVSTAQTALQKSRGITPGAPYEPGPYNTPPGLEAPVPETLPAVAPPPTAPQQQGVQQTSGPYRVGQIRRNTSTGQRQVWTASGWMNMQ